MRVHVVLHVASHAVGAMPLVRFCLSCVCVYVRVCHYGIFSVANIILGNGMKKRVKYPWVFWCRRWGSYRMGIHDLRRIGALLRNLVASFCFVCCWSLGRRNIFTI